MFKMMKNEGPKGQMRAFGLLLFCLFTFSFCHQKPRLLTQKETAADFHAAMNKLTEVIIYDIFSPPVASRIYAYSTLAAFEAMRSEDSKMASMAGRVNGFSAPPSVEKGEICLELAGLQAFLTVVRTLTFSTQYYDEFEKAAFEKYENALAPSVFERSKKHGEAVGQHVLAFAKTDNYGPTRGLRYTLKKGKGTWEPTPPSYADAVEPNWGRIRPMVLDSAGQFRMAAPAPFSTSKTSAFWREVEDVFSLSKNLTAEQKRIAWFWDDNAFVAEIEGHTMVASKKMTPGGHWLAIAQKRCQTENLTAIESARVAFLVSAALFDGFINCWKIKFETERIRPETVINASIDKNWEPYLQTPPFPEFPSGHSTISAASAEVLSAFFGEATAFVDSTEWVFGHGVGHFSSFRQAAAEASTSRVFGGIHFRSGCDAGADLGKRVGQRVLEKLK